MEEGKKKATVKAEDTQGNAKQKCSGLVLLRLRQLGILTTKTSTIRTFTTSTPTRMCTTSTPTRTVKAQ